MLGILAANLYPDVYARVSCHHRRGTSLPALCAPVPWRCRFRISPQPALLCLRLRFRVGVLLASLWWEFLGAAPEAPGQASPDLLVGQHPNSASPPHQGAADLATVSVTARHSTHCL